MEKQNDGKSINPKLGKIEFIGIDANENRPEVALYLIEQSTKSISMIEVDQEGNFKLPSTAIRKTQMTVTIAPKTEDLKTLDKKMLCTFRISQFTELLEKTGVIEIPQTKWRAWWMIRYCVSGSVKHCHLWIPLFLKPILAAKQQLKLAINTDLEFRTLSDYEVAKPLDMLQPLWPPFFCQTVCDGLVEVYRRNCCCFPWVIYDPRLPELIEELERLTQVIPEVKWPPRPEPDPLPIERQPFYKNGAIDKKIENAHQDLLALKTLPANEIPEYILKRPYLFCNCDTPTKVAQGFIHPDGEFHICWWEWMRIMPINCHDEYAYVIKQNIDGETVTIYDGVAAHQWFDYEDKPVLRSFHPRALSCRHVDIPGEDAFTLLQDIGNTNSYHLKTPDATGWDRVAAPLFNDGLAFPEDDANAAKGQYMNRNWGGMLSLRYFFSEEMRNIGARYYRVSVIPADSNGNPTGTRTYLQANRWKYYEISGSDILVRYESLEANSIGGQHNLLKIPYDADRIWQSGQYHAIINTNEHADGRFLLTLELFNDAGKLLRPTGTPDPDGSVEAGFSFRRWYQAVGDMAEVPYAALTHMLWWDNRKAVAEIVDLRKNSNLINTQECQFLVGPEDATFSAGYRAYHPEPMFMLNHRLWWRRGLNGSTGNLTDPHPNPNNVGVPPNSPHESGTNTFSQMLGTHPKCSFSLNLHVNVKTFNGFGTIDDLDAWDQAAFALEIET